MRNTIRSLAALAGLAAVAAAGPALADVGQCFDAYGRPFGPPHDTDNPPYELICRAYSIGGSCTHVLPGWAQSNCGLGPRYPANRSHPYYDQRYPETHRFNREGDPRRQYRPDRPQRFQPPDPTQPPAPFRPAPNTAR